jgi:hypothetical protein
MEAIQCVAPGTIPLPEPLYESGIIRFRHMSHHLPDAEGPGKVNPAFGKNPLRKSRNMPAGGHVEDERTTPEGPMAKFLLWLILAFFCWPLAVLALILYPFVWLLSLPFRLLGITVDALFQFIRALFLLPARVLGGSGVPR